MYLPNKWLGNKLFFILNKTIFVRQKSKILFLCDECSHTNKSVNCSGPLHLAGQFADCKKQGSECEWEPGPTPTCSPSHEPSQRSSDRPKVTTIPIGPGPKILWPGKPFGPRQSAMVCPQFRAQICHVC